MESLERKDASVGPEEPIKSEDVVPSLDANERTNNAASPPPNCSICLGKLVNTSFTDSCLHQFCFTCLLQWSKIKTECPLCKQTFKSIIHNVRSEEDYDQYHVQYTSLRDVTADIHITSQWDVSGRPFMYRTTMGASRYGMMLNPESVARREQIPSYNSSISSEERRRRNANPIDYRRTVYRHGVWAACLPDAFGRLRESSAEYYRRHPLEVNRLIPWLNRELLVLLNNNRPHIAYVLRVISDSVTQYNIQSTAFRNIVRPFFGIHTDHFVHELSNYASSNFDLVGYDQAVNYMPNRGLSNEYVDRTISPTLSSSSSMNITPTRRSSSSTDSDVHILEDSVLNSSLNYYNMPSIGPHLIDIPGPSTAGQAFRIQLPYTVPTFPSVLTISSTSSSSENECEVIGYVKPRHERTPEIIDLSSEAEEVIVTTNQPMSIENSQTESSLPTETKDENLPSTSSSYNNISRRTRRCVEGTSKAQILNYLDTTSESDSEESDSDYNPLSSKSRRHKTVSKKSSKVSLRKLRSRKRKKSNPQRKRDKEPRSQSPYTSSDNESPQRGSFSSRGTKRYLSKSSDASDYGKVTKKKKSKKAKSSKKEKKRRATASSSKNIFYNSRSSSTNSFSSDSDEKKSKSTKRKTKKTAINLYEYSSGEISTNEKSSSKSSSTRKASQGKDSSTFTDSPYRSVSFRGSSSESLDSRKNLDRLHSTSDDEELESHGHSSRSISSDGACSSNLPSESCKSSTTGQIISQPSDKFSTIISNSSSKSDGSSPTEHSVLSNIIRDRHRSHKKRKESKKRRRSHS